VCLCSHTTTSIWMHLVFHLFNLFTGIGNNKVDWLPLKFPRQGTGTHTRCLQDNTKGNECGNTRIKNFVACLFHIYGFIVCVAKGCVHNTGMRLSPLTEWGNFIVSSVLCNSSQWKDRVTPPLNNYIFSQSNLLNPTKFKFSQLALKDGYRIH